MDANEGGRKCTHVLEKRHTMWFSGILSHGNAVCVYVLLYCVGIKWWFSRSGKWNACETDSSCFEWMGIMTEIDRGRKGNFFCRVYRQKSTFEHLSWRLFYWSSWTQVKPCVFFYGHMVHFALCFANLTLSRRKKTTKFTAKKFVSSVWYCDEDRSQGNGR